MQNRFSKKIYTAINSYEIKYSHQIHDRFLFIMRPPPSLLDIPIPVHTNKDVVRNSGSQSTRGRGKMYQLSCLNSWW